MQADRQAARLINTNDAPEVTGYGEPFQVTPWKVIMKVLQDDIIKHANFDCFQSLTSILKKAMYKDLDRNKLRYVIVQDI